MKHTARFQQLVLPFVRKPNRYTGLELNVIRKDQPIVRWALAFPDLYEIGMSHLGLRILYHRINQCHPEIAAERVFLPDEATSSRLRREKIPLHTLESGTALSDVDIVGISLSYEMAMPGMLELLDLGGIPIYARERSDSDPIVIAGGPVAYNPEPAADFLDAVAIGDGEEIVVEISHILLDARRKGLSRNEILDRLGKLEGIYLPHRYEIHEDKSGYIQVGAPSDNGLPLIIQGCTVETLRADYYPDKPLLPIAEIVHDRLNLEVMRGCTHGCRFCHAGMIYRPVRERPVDDVIQQAIDGIAATGYEEIGLTSLSTSDYSRLSELIEGLHEAFRGKGVSLSFPSLRPDSFTPGMAKSFPGGKKGGITFAPEAGTQRLRDIINKNTREEDLLRASRLVYEEGWNGIKLYFMIGLPEENKEDLDGIVNLAFKVAKLREKGRQKTTVSVNSFIPKAHTPFQWFGQDKPEILREKLRYLRRKFQGSPVRFSAHDPYNALYEGALARGDRRLAGVIERVWRMGGVLEAWHDRFDSQRWVEAFKLEGIDPFDYVRSRKTGEKLPWRHISKGILDKFNSREWKKAQETKTTPDCRTGKCYNCGLTQMIPDGAKVCNSYPDIKPLAPALPEERSVGTVECIARLRYARGEEMRWTGHLDLVRMWDRLLRRAAIPVAYSQGFSPHPRMSFAPPLPVGLVSVDEYLDIDLCRRIEAKDLLDELSAAKTIGLEPIEVVIFEKSPKSLAMAIERIEYSFQFDDTDIRRKALNEWLSCESYFVERKKKGKTRRVDIKPFVEDIEQKVDGLWLLRLKLVEGATVRFEELAAAWGLERNAFQGAVRRAMLVQTPDGWTDPISSHVSTQKPLSRAGN